MGAVDPQRRYKMKTIYTAIITETTDKKIPYLVYVPDFDATTQGEDLADALLMAEDIISLSGIEYEDAGKALPKPTPIENIDMTTSHWVEEDGDTSFIITEFKSLVPVDFDLYRRKLKNTAVRRNVSLPAWLDAEATKAGINVSALLQSALKQELHV
jgi:predicted RNase H-like HicB family nuclease